MDNGLKSGRIGNTNELLFYFFVIVGTVVIVVAVTAIVVDVVVVIVAVFICVVDVVVVVVVIVVVLRNESEVSGLYKLVLLNQFSIPFSFSKSLKMAIFGLFSNFVHAFPS